MEKDNCKADSAQGRPSGGRLVSLDVLRGFDMFWIVGGDRFVKTLLLALGLHETHKVVSRQLVHVPWHGFAAYDLIFPLFLFIAGVTMPFSLTKYIQRGDSRRRLYFHIVKRGLLLVLFGCIYNGMLSLDFANLRYPSVLGFIGLSWMFAAVIFVNTNWKGQLAWCIGLLAGYWAAMSWVSVPGYGAGDLSMGGNLVGFIDRSYLPGRLYRGNFDPQGLFSVVSGIGTALFGVMAGHILCAARSDGRRLAAVGKLVASGAVCIGVSLVWNRWFPINKEMWTSSFTVLTAGISFILLSLFYLVVDVIGFKKWTLPFVVIGMNPITIYMASQFIHFGHMTNYFFGGLTGRIGGPWGNFTWAAGYMLLELLFLYFLYRKKVFLRV